MYILTVAGKEQEGAYSVIDDNGEKILYIFEKEDDAIRYSMMLEEDKQYPDMNVIEVDDKVMISTCESHGYNYAVITENGIVVPPSNAHHDII